MRLPAFTGLVLLAFVVSSHAGTITLNDASPGVVFSSNWTIAPTATGQNFSVSTDIGAYLAVNIPNGTVSAEYFGFKSSGGSAYGVCLDCVGNTTFQVIDGHDGTLTTNEPAPPTVLFSILTLDPTVPHVLVVYNLPDVRFADTGEITFQSLVLYTNDGGGDSGDGVSNLGPSNSNGSNTSDGADSADQDSSNNGGGGSNPDANLPPGGVTFTVAKTSPPSTSTSPAVASETPSPSSPQTTTADDPDPTDVTSEPSSTTMPPSAPTSQLTSPSESFSSSTPIPTGSINNEGTANDSNSSVSSTPSRQRVSAALIAVISILCVLSGLALVVGLFFFLRRRRPIQQSLSRLPGPEDDPNANSRTPLRRASSPTIGAPAIMRQSSSARGGVPPERPRNPNEGTSPPNEPLDGDLGLEYPGDSTLMKKRMRAKTTSSFGNLVLASQRVEV